MVSMECSRVFTVVFTGLVLATAGFCLTLAGWFAPPINDSVRGVRFAGPVLLVVGLLTLGLSCLICGIKQERCCYDCIQLYRDRRKQAQQRHLEKAAARLRVTQNAANAQPIPALLHDADCDALEPKCALPVAQFAPEAHVAGACPVFANQSARLEMIPSIVSSAPRQAEVGVSDVDEPSSFIEQRCTMYEGVGVRVKQFRTVSRTKGDESEIKHLLEKRPSPTPTSSPRASPYRLRARSREADHVTAATNSPAGSEPRPKLCSHVPASDKPDPDFGGIVDPGPVWTPRAGHRNKFALNTKDARPGYIQHSNV